MDIRFHVDRETGRPHIERHGIDEGEVRQVLENAAEDRQGREDSRVTIGQTAAGRYVKVVYVPDPDRSSVFVITAYPLTGKALKAFRARRRRRAR
jgi:hypothetical protein